MKNWLRGDYFFLLIMNIAEPTTTTATNNANFYANGNTVVINGQSKTVSVTFTAYSQPSKPSNSGISGIELYSIIGVVVAVVVVGSAIFMMRRKK